MTLKSTLSGTLLTAVVLHLSCNHTRFRGPKDMIISFNTLLSVLLVSQRNPLWTRLWLAVFAPPGACDFVKVEILVSRTSLSRCTLLWPPLALQASEECLCAPRSTITFFSLVKFNWGKGTPPFYNLFPLALSSTSQSLPSHGYLARSLHLPPALKYETSKKEKNQTWKTKIIFQKLAYYNWKVWW